MMPILGVSKEDKYPSYKNLKILFLTED